MADEAVEKTSHDQGVFQVVFFFTNMLSRFPKPVQLLHILCPVPDVPLVKAQVMPFLAPGLGLYVTAKCVHDLDLLVDGIANGQVIGRIALHIADVAVQADKVGVVAHVLQHRPVPLHISWQADFGRTA